jgi:hypothetical protein
MKEMAATSIKTNARTEFSRITSLIFNFKEANLEHEVKKVTHDNFIRKSLIQIITEEN